MENEKVLSGYLSMTEAPIDDAWVFDMLERYPTFYFPAALMLKRCPRSVDAETINFLRTAVILNCPDRSALADFTDIADADWANIYPRESIDIVCSTEQAIDTFIQNYGHNVPDEDEVLEKLIFNPTPDYFSGTDEPYDPADPLALPPELMPEENKNDIPDVDGTTADSNPPSAPNTISETPPADASLPTTDIPDANDVAIQGNANVQPQTEEPTDTDINCISNTHKPSTNQDNQDSIRQSISDSANSHENANNTPYPGSEESSLMESLSKFFIKQHRYERAYEIISKLSLNYPEKSVYFADQMRFLQKLILNQQCFKNKK